MKLKTKDYELQSTSIDGTMAVEKQNGRSTIIIDFGDKRKNEQCVKTFQFKSDKLKVVNVDGSCGCMGASTFYNLQDGTQQIKIQYASKRIPNIDSGHFTKSAAAKLSNGEWILFKIKINGIK